MPGMTKGLLLKLERQMRQAYKKNKNKNDQAKQALRQRAMRHNRITPEQIASIELKIENGN